jgi:hypothetical protein
VCSDYLYKRSGSPPPNREEEASLVLFQFAPLPRSEHRNACDKCAERVRDRQEGVVVRWGVGGSCGCRGWGAGGELSWQSLRLEVIVALVVGIGEAVLAFILV